MDFNMLCLLSNKWYVFCPLLRLTSMCVCEHGDKMPFAFVLSMIISAVTLSKCQFQSLSVTEISKNRIMLSFHQKGWKNIDNTFNSCSTECERTLSWSLKLKWKWTLPFELNFTKDRNIQGTSSIDDNMFTDSVYKESIKANTGTHFLVVLIHFF